MLYTRKGDDGKTEFFSAKGGPASGWGCDLPAPRLGIFFVYAILCENDSIYIGQTNDLYKRLDEHRNGSGAKYTKNFGVQKIIHYEEFSSRDKAVKREHDLKTGFGRKWLKREWLAGRTRQAGQRFSKSSIIAEALGSLDELNSFLGIVKSRCNQGQTFLQIQGLTLISVVHEIQENIFIIQAQVAGVDKKISEEKVKEVEKIIDGIEKEIPKIKSFIIPGANEISAMFDFARTLARKTERRVVAVSEENIIKIDSNTLKYLNRLSSLLYVLARFSALEKGEKESNPTYS